MKRQASENSVIRDFQSQVHRTAQKTSSFGRRAVVAMTKTKKDDSEERSSGDGGENLAAQFPHKRFRSINLKR